MTATKAKSSNRGSKPGERRGGRKAGTPNKATAELRDLARNYTEAALTALVGILAGGEGIPAAAQVAAAREILDRGHGKAAQLVDANLSGGAMSDEMKRWLGIG